MPRLAIIIPVLGDTRHLDDTLLSVLENRPADCEIVVVHNRPYADPYNLADEVRFIEALQSSGMVDCLNLGLAATQAPLVHFLACGVEVCPGWAEAAMRRFADPNIAAVASVVVDRDDRQNVVSAGLGYRLEGSPWRVGERQKPAQLAKHISDFRGPDIMAAFYRKSAIDALGGIPHFAGDSLAGIDLALTLQDAGYRSTLEPQCLAHVASSVLNRDSSFQHGWQAERLFWRWAKSHGLFASVFGHAAMLAGQCVIGLWRPFMLLQLAGRVFGAIHSVFSARRRKISKIRCVEEQSHVVSPEFSGENDSPALKSPYVA